MRGFILYFVLLMKSHLQSYPCPFTAAAVKHLISMAAAEEWERLIG